MSLEALINPLDGHDYQFAAVSVVKAVAHVRMWGLIEPAPYTSRQPGLLGSVRWYWMGPMPLMAMIAGSVSVFFTPS